MRFYTFCKILMLVYSFTYNSNSDFIVWLNHTKGGEIVFLLKDVKYNNILNIKSLFIPVHKITCIVGESGSGKTTLLKLLNKLISCDSGDIFYKDKPISKLDSIELRREVMMLSQTPAIFKGSIRDNLLMGFKLTEKEEAPSEILKDVLANIKLNKSLDEDASNLSGGEKQRLALGRILLLKPEVYLLDEPSSALDEETEQIIVKKMVDCVKENGKTLIMVTHSKSIAGRFGENIIQLRDGRVVTEGGV